MFEKKTIKDVDVSGKTVLVRVDYNVPMNGTEVESDIRIRASLPTIEYLISNGAKRIVLISHLGRPKGERKLELSLKPVAEKLSEILENSIIRTHAGVIPTVKFASEVSGDVVKSVISDSIDGGIILLENLRFWPDEEKNNADFAKAIVESTGADLFVQDGFAVIHRAHASTDAVTKFLPSVAGLLVEKEVSVLNSAISNPEHPVVVIIGGAKVDDKKPLIDKFLPIADKIIVGGKIAADGYESESDKIYVAEDFSRDNLGAKLDIGTVSTKKILEDIHNAKTVVWNGVVGLAEQHPFDMASRTIARAIGNNSSLTSIICGGDTTGFVESLQMEEPELRYSLISTGGGASLELLSGLELPGLVSLQEK